MSVESNYASPSKLKNLALVFSTNDKKSKTSSTLCVRVPPRIEQVYEIARSSDMVHRPVCSCCDWSV